MSYSAKDIQIPDGIEHIRLRPSMYVGDTGIDGYHHLLQEVVDNAVDEHLDGHVTEIRVVINTDTQDAYVQDNGRGIPVSKHSKAKISTLIAVFTRLHAGGKYGKGAYCSTVRGLHGIGVKATNALSSYLLVRTKRKQTTWAQEFHCGIPQENPKKARYGKLAKGTSVLFRPDPEIFLDVKWDVTRIYNWLRDVAYLCPGLLIVYTQHNDAGEEEVHQFESSVGLSAMLQDYCTSLDYDNHTDIIVIKDEHFDATFLWTDATGEHWRSFANVAPTPNHGTHVQGVRKAIQDALNEGPQQNQRGDDLRDGLVGIIHAKVLKPKFQGQTKMRLENTEVEQQIYDVVLQHLQRYGVQNPDTFKKIQDRAKQLKVARQKFRDQQKAIKGTRVKRGARGILPGKLVEAPDCGPSQRELFIVEGDSAGGNVEKARIKTKVGRRQVHYQEVFPLRGKLVNAARKGGISDVVKNAEIKDLFTALGTGVGDSFDLRKCRYNGIYLLMDADPDGQHIRALVLSLFAKHLPKIIEAGLLYCVQNPLFMGVSAKRRVYGDTVEEVKKQLGREKHRVARFKGLGESNAEDLRIYALDPNTRETVLVQWGGQDDQDKVLRYMGLDSSARKDLLGIVE